MQLPILLAASLLAGLPVQRLTPVLHGPLHANGNRIVDSRGREVLLRGSQVPDFSLKTAASGNDSEQRFGPYSATTFSCIRQRWNMNVVRLAIDAAEAERDPSYLREVGRVVRRANELELLVVLAARDHDAAFWRHCALFFKSYPNVVFDVVPGDPPSGAGWPEWRKATQAVVDAIRASGATQPIAVSPRNGSTLFEGLEPEHFIRDSNVIYEVAPRYRTTRTDADRQRQFGILAEQKPVLANGWELGLDEDSADCASIPADPSLAEKLVQDGLRYFETHHISWTASVFEPGKLITNYQDQDATTLENGWTCGRPAAMPAGLGAVVQFHLWSGEVRGLFAVNGSGSMLLPRGGVAIAYGPILAERDTQNARPVPPTSLGKLSLKVTDHLGHGRLARLMWVSAGWGQINFVVPPETAAGPARITLQRADGSSAIASATIADVAPGFLSPVANSRGPVIAFVTQSRNGKNVTFPSFRCTTAGCRTVPIRVSRDQATTVRLIGTGLRNTRGDVRVMIGGIRVPVLRYGPSAEPGADEVTIELTPALRGLGEADVICSVDGRLSNVVRLNIGPG